jgi:hypothetical protein
MPDQIVYQFGRISAVRYGNIHGEWDEGAPTRIAQFVLGHDVSSRITPLNETLMRVVQPVDQFWDPKNGLADIIITDPETTVRMGLGLGMWLAKYPTGQFRPMPHNQVVASYLPPPPSESFEVELRNLLAKHERHKGSGTPDHVLAEFVLANLSAYNAAVRKRAKERNESVS